MSLALLLCAGPAVPHALQPGFLELRSLGAETWRVFWKVPTSGAGRLPLDAVLPESCEQRRSNDLTFDGTAYVARWVTRCPGGLEGGEIRIEGLERTQTDVLVRYELTSGRAESERLTASTTSFVVPRPQGSWGVFKTYLSLGIDHILRGADHLLFVFALILLIPSRRKLIEAVTAFTAAHSLSLAGATLGWLVVPSPPVEAVVALSIMYLAAELVRTAHGGLGLTQRWSWVVAFAFGLLHGLGFARALLEVGLPEGEVPAALFAFNVGVEIGQLLFITLIIVVAGLLRRIYPAVMALAAGQRGLGVAGYLIGSVAAFWLVGRVAVF